MAKLLIRQQRFKDAEDALRSVPIDDDVLDILKAAHEGTKDKK
jgi:hypothetical protein